MRAQRSARAPPNVPGFCAELLHYMAMDRVESCSLGWVAQAQTQVGYTGHAGTWRGNTEAQQDCLGSIFQGQKYQIKGALSL